MQIVHGLSVPLGKLGYRLPRTISSALEANNVEEPQLFNTGESAQDVQELLRRRRSHGKESSTGTKIPLQPVFRIGGTVMATNSSAPQSRDEVISQDSKRVEENSPAIASSDLNPEAP